MATTFNDNGGNTPNGSHLNFTYTFPVIKNADVKVALNGITQASTKYTVNSGVNPTRIEFNNTSIDSTLQESTGAPKTGVVVRVYRDTGLEDPADRRVTFQAGSAIRAQDLNNMYDHLIFSTQEEQNQLERITDADVIPTAEIQVSKLKDGAARQVLQTDAAGTGVEWTSNVDIPGTLDVTSTAAFDGNISVAGTTTAVAINASGAVGVDGNFDVNTNKFTVAASSGNTVIAGDLDVAGNFEVTGTSLHTGQQTVPGGAQVKNIKVGLDAPNEVSTTSGNLVLDSASGTVQITDHFNVTGNADVDTNLNVDGTLTVDGTSTLTGNTSIGGTLTVTGTTNLAAGSIGNTEIADDAVRTVHIKDLNVTRQKIDNDAINQDKIADDAVRSEHILANAIGTSELDSDAVTTTHIVNDAVTIDKIADSVIVTASEQGSHSVNDASFFTTSAAEARFFNASTGETIKDGDAFPDNDTTIATTAAINDRIIDLVDDVGGFVPIANETSFPNANPDVNNGSGTLVSIKALASNQTSNGSGVISISNGTVGNSTVTITGATNNTTFNAGFGMIVETTSTLNTYAFHRLVPKATEVTTVASKATEIGRLGTAAAVEDLGILGTTAVVEDLAILGTNDVVSDLNTLATNAIVSNLDTCATNVGNINTVGGAITNVNNVGGSISNVNTVATNISDVNNFADLYQIAGSNPSTDGGGNSLAAGDLYFNTSADELKVWNGSAWQGGVTASGNFAAVTGNTFTGDNKYNDGVKILTGTGSDLEIFHASDVNNIKSVNGKIVVQTTAGNADIEVTPHGSGKVKLDGLSWPTADGSANQVLQTNGSGALSFATIAVGGATGTDYNDDVKVRFGNGNDLAIYHDGTNTLNFIDAINGNLRIRVDGTDNAIQCKASNAVELYFDGAQKFQTTSTGCGVTGNLTFADNGKAIFGASDDLQVFHSGSNSFINHNGQGDLFVQAQGTDENLWLRAKHDVFIQPNDNHNSAKFIAGGAVELYHNNAKKFQTTANGIHCFGQLEMDGSNNIDLQDSGAILLGTSDDLQIFHNGSASFIDDTGDGALIIRSNNAVDIKDSDNDMMAAFNKDADVKLFHNGSEKLATTANGASITGRLDLSDNLDMPDNAKVILGTDDDLKVYHTNSHGFVENATGELKLTSDTIRLQSKTNNELFLWMQKDGRVELYFNDAKRFETNSAGCGMNGDLTFADGDKAIFGAGDDLQISHTGSFNLINATNGFLQYRASSHFINNQDNSQNFIRCESGLVSLHHNNNKKFETNSSGTKTFGTHIMTSGGNVTGGNMDFADNSVARFGNDQDFRIFHSGSENKIQAMGSTEPIVMLVRDGAETSAVFKANGAAELYYDSVKHFETTSIGAKIFDNDTTTALQFNTTSGDNGYVFADGTNTLGFKDNNPQWMVECTKGGSVELFHNGNGKLETASWGVGITGNCSPTASNTHDLGSSSARWNNLYVNDMHFSNHPDNPNSVDGTWGDWTLQEGEEDIFMINNRSGKKYKMALTEVS